MQQEVSLHTEATDIAVARDQQVEQDPPASFVVGQIRVSASLWYGTECECSTLRQEALHHEEMETAWCIGHMHALMDPHVLCDHFRLRGSCCDSSYQRL